MLSRIAESLFWIGRYVERAEDTARILDVQTQLILEDPGVDEETTCRNLLSIMGVEIDFDDPVEAARTIDTDEVLRVLAHDVHSPASIAATLAAARESARRARETLSTSMWEALNTTYRAIPSGHFRSMRPPVAFRWVRDRAAQFNGIAEATMTRDEGYQFLMLGRSIERADMTSRLVATAALTSGAAWGTSLRACGAYEAFLRTYRGLETERGAAEFLLLDRLFPRSVVFGLTQAERCLENLESAGTRAGVQNEAQRLLGRTRAELEYRSLSDFVSELPSEMERLQRTCALATDAITRRYFAGAEATEWHGVRGMMQLRIAHTTGFEYDGKANTSFNEARLTPTTLPGQIVIHSRVEVSPTPWAYTYKDYWGSQVTAFEVLDPHQSLTVTASATVATDRTPAGDPRMSWEQMRSPEVADLHTEFLTLPERVEPTEDLVARTREIVDASASPTDAAREVCALVYQEVSYETGSTTVDAFAAHSWKERHGVCQDMAHIVIGALRSAGIPARYVSGYLHPKVDPEVGVPARGESHAWVEWWDDGWRGFDPTNDTEPGDRHVIVATGRDYNDVKPLSGIFSGSGTSRMFVEVQVTRLS